MSLVLWVLALSALLLGLRAVAHPVMPLRSAKALFFPGVLVAIIGRSVACALAGARLEGVHAWREGEVVEHEKPALPIVGDFLLAIVPFVAAMGAILGSRAALGYPIELDVRLPDLDPSLGALSTVADGSVRLLRALATSLRGLDRDSWRAAAFLYVALATNLYAAPNYEGWKRLATAIGGVGLLCWGAEWLGIQAGFLSRGWFIKTLYGDPVLDALALLVTAALVALLLFTVARASWAFSRAILRPRRKKKR
jgi:hypothetical protein